MPLFHSLTIELEVRTEAESGLLFYMARINHADFATVQLRNGFPYFSYDLGSGDTNTMIPTKINDGQWHKVTVPGCWQCPARQVLAGSLWHSPGASTVLPGQTLTWCSWNSAKAKNKASAVFDCQPWKCDPTWVGLYLTTYMPHHSAMRSHHCYTAVPPKHRPTDKGQEVEDILAAGSRKPGE